MPCLSLRASVLSQDRGIHQPPQCTPNPSLEVSFSCLYGTLSSGREKILQDASLTYQQLKNGRDNLSSWLEQLPHHQVQPSDGPGQLAYKLQAQKVRAGGMGWGLQVPVSFQPPLQQGQLLVFLRSRLKSKRLHRSDQEVVAGWPLPPNSVLNTAFPGGILFILAKAEGAKPGAEGTKPHPQALHLLGKSIPAAEKHF